MPDVPLPECNLLSPSQIDGRLMRTKSRAHAPQAVTPGSDLTTDIVTDLPSFIALEAEWNEAVDRSASVAQAFLRHEWLRTWWECFAEGRTLHLVIVRAAGKILAIAPLMRETVMMYGLPIRRIDFLHNDHTPRADLVIVDRADEARRAIWTTLVDSSYSWDLLQLSRVPRISATLDAMQNLAEDSGYTANRWEGDVSPYLELTDNWDDYQMRLGSKLRSNLRNRLSRLTRLGTPALEVLQDAAAVKQALDETLALEASGWKKTSGTAIGSNPAIQRFYTLLAEREAMHGRLRLMFLTVNGVRIATAFGLREDDRLLQLKMGYDPAYASCSPSKLLTYFTIQAAYTEGLRELDFLGFTERWKLDWTDTSRPQDWLFVFSGSRRARMLRSIKFKWVPAIRAWRT